MKEPLNARKSVSPSGRGGVVGGGNEKTFMTQQNKDDEHAGVWKAFDFLYPAGRLAKLVRVVISNVFSDIFSYVLS